MKLLILTQKVNLDDDVLGFMHGWIEEFSKKCGSITVVCLEQGNYKLPGNVEVFSLGKERGGLKIKYLINFYKYIWRERKNYDAVFVHMNYEYVILGGLFWQLLNKKIGLWYAHGYAPLGLKIAEKLVDIIFTSTRSGFRLASRKIKIVGQGIDINKFEAQDMESRANHRNKIISIGRLSPSKDYKTLILAFEILKNKGLALRVELIGGPAVESDKIYADDLSRLVEEKKLSGMIKFIGPVAHKEISRYLRGAGLFVNMGLTGSLDKAMVEAMAAELPVITCNEAMTEVLGDYKEVLMYPKKNYEKLAEKIEQIVNLPFAEYKELAGSLREIVVTRHSLSELVLKIIKEY
ncbi:MAG: glycosyltransferase family 4 protein [bacterium]|nr:glycosyltransferase family 4 protein [bacterium]